jgi:hypothetical protein
VTRLVDLARPSRRRDSQPPFFLSESRTSLTAHSLKASAMPPVIMT